MIGKVLELIFGSSTGSTVTVNGVTYKGNSVIIENNKVFIDGKESSGSLGETITVTVNGDCESVDTCSGDVTVKGKVNGPVSTTSGDVYRGAR